MSLGGPPHPVGNIKGKIIQDREREMASWRGSEGEGEGLVPNSSSCKLL